LEEKAKVGSICKQKQLYRNRLPTI
jgi:hypothetical protein